MRRPKIREQAGVREAREAYFAGRISVGEYLRRALAAQQEQEEGARPGADGGSVQAPAGSQEPSVGQAHRTQPAGPEPGRKTNRLPGPGRSLSPHEQKLLAEQIRRVLQRLRAKAQ